MVVFVRSKFEMFGPCIRNDTDRRIREIKFFVTDESFIASQLGFQWNGKTVSIRVLFLDVNISTGETKRDSRSTRNFPPLFNELIESFFALNLIISFVVLFLSSGKIGENYRNGITADRELEQFFPLYHPFSLRPGGWKRLHPSIPVNGRTNAFNVRQIELTYTALCADCMAEIAKRCDSFGVGKARTISESMDGTTTTTLNKGMFTRAKHACIEAHRSRSVANDRPPRRVATRESRWPQSAAPFHYVFRYDISIVDGSEIKLLCSRACGGVRVAHKSTSTCNTWGNTWSYYEYWNRISAHYRVKYFNG